jgi:hypothetical protein
MSRIGPAPRHPQPAFPVAVGHDDNSLSNDADAAADAAVDDADAAADAAADDADAAADAAAAADADAAAADAADADAAAADAAADAADADDADGIFIIPIHIAGGFQSIITKRRCVFTQALVFFQIIRQHALLGRTSIKLEWLHEVNSWVAATHGSTSQPGYNPRRVTHPSNA